MKTISRKVIYTMTALIFLTTLAILFVNPSQKEITDQAIKDATFLVNLNAPRAQMEADLTQKLQVTLTKVSNGLIRLGAKVIDQEAFVDALIEYTPKNLAEDIHNHSIQVYAQSLKESDLAELVAFYRTSTGRDYNALIHLPAAYEQGNADQVIADWKATLPPEQSEALKAFTSSNANKALLAALPKMRSEIAAFSIKQGTIQMQNFNIAHIAPIMEREDIVQFESPAARKTAIARLSSGQQSQSQRKAREIALSLLPEPNKTDQAFPKITLEIARKHSAMLENLGGNPDDIDTFTQTLATTSAHQLALERHRMQITQLTRTFSLQELKDIAEFEASPTGRAFYAKEPHIKSYTKPTPEDLQWIQNRPPEQSNAYFTFIKSKGGQALAREEENLFSTTRRDIERKAMKIVASNMIQLLQDESLMRFDSHERRLSAIKILSETHKQAGLTDMR